MPTSHSSDSASSLAGALAGRVQFAADMDFTYQDVVAGKHRRSDPAADGVVANTGQQELPMSAWAQGDWPEDVDDVDEADGPGVLPQVEPEDEATAEKRRKGTAEARAEFEEQAATMPPGTSADRIEGNDR